MRRWNGVSDAVVGLRKGIEKYTTFLKKQDGLYTLIVKHPDGKNKNQDIIWFNMQISC